MHIRSTFAFLLAMALLVATAAPAQAPQSPRFIAGASYSLTAAPAYFTLQVPANAARRIYPIAASVECPTVCTVTQDLNGNPADTTEITPVQIAGTANTPTAKVFAPSNSGAGSTLAAFTIPAATPYPLDLTSIGLEPYKASIQTYNIRTSAVTGTARVYVIWAEQ